MRAGPIETQLPPSRQQRAPAARFVQFHPTALSDEGLPIRPNKGRENAFL
jgi:hypothetical protein